MNISEFTNQMNEWGHEKVPFVFIVDFEMEKPVIMRMSDVNPLDIMFDVQGFSNVQLSSVKQAIAVSSFPDSFEVYKSKFDKVFRHLRYGDSFLTNLTVKTRIEIDHSLLQLFSLSKAKYKLYYRNEFLVFSPESFVRIKNNRIHSFPMKGTIDATIHDARNLVLNNEKEIAEHVTIVDLIRNDLSRVSSGVDVTRFRYIDEIRSSNKTLLQVSSEIVGELPPGYLSHLGDIFFRLLPAGSITGAPKPRTVEIIREAENEKRGYFTGVFGYFDGTNLDSGVMIRYIERAGNQYFYRSGGGITTRSKAETEYKEVLDKIYVPVD